MADRTLLRLSATLLFIGELLFLLAGVFHQMDEGKAPVNANNHSVAFAAYAASGNWWDFHRLLGME